MQAWVSKGYIGSSDTDYKINCTQLTCTIQRSVAGHDGHLHDFGIHRYSVQISGDPKLLVTPLQPEKLARFSLTSLERTSKRALVLEADLGIPINLLDIDRYAVPAQPPVLDPEDLALLEVRTA